MKAIKFPGKACKPGIIIFFSIILSAFTAPGLTAQKGHAKTTITGRVVDASMYPVPNAVVMIDGRDVNVLTNSDGRYKVRVDGNADMIGILTAKEGFLELPVNGMKRINFQFSNNLTGQPAELKPDTGDEDVNIGYGTIKKKHISSQATTLEKPVGKKDPYSNIYEMIQEEAAGVRVNGTDIIIPGAGFYQEAVPPLLVVDGTTVNTLSGIPPSAVESITVLKSASATIYGTRGYGGAVVLTTKGGR
jgi:TonB-dependent SusC/RagA subfamily outer membrane receptor